MWGTKYEKTESITFFSIALIGKQTVRSLDDVFTLLDTVG